MTVCIYLNSNMVFINWVLADIKLYSKLTFGTADLDSITLQKRLYALVTSLIKAQLM